jgi:Tfp pilus assembly pilus retraction ATPase PilT
MAISLDDILQAAEDHKASDVFLQEGEVPRMKINEQLMIFGDEPLLLPQMAGLWQACGGDTLNDTDRGHRPRLPLRHVRFRVNLHKVLGRHGRHAAPHPHGHAGAEFALGAPDWLLQRWAQKQHGMVLVTGSTGQGKSTTLAALLQWMNDERRPPCRDDRRSGRVHLHEQPLPLHPA